MSGETVRTGGCQCGAIRFRITGDRLEGSICHCRMCQKATGGLFGAAIGVDDGDLEWTRGATAAFQSSSVATRGFCRDCGTPMTFVWEPGYTAINAGCFDQPDMLTFTVALGSDHIHPAVPTLAEVPARPMFDTPEAERAYAEMVSYQHPDHDTKDWPKGGRR